MTIWDEQPVARVALHLHRASIQPDDERPIYGARVGIASFLDALVRHAEPGIYRFFFTRSPFGGAHPELEVLRQLVSLPSPGTFQVADIRDLTRDFPRFPFRVWHDADADFETAARLRASYSPALYPITAMTHVYSYQNLLHDWVLKLLLGRTYACDRVICPGQAARNALVNILDAVSDRLSYELEVRCLFRGQVLSIPYAIDTDLFRPRDKAVVRRELQLPEDALLILWVGRISPVDKADLLPLVRVHARLVRANPLRKLVLVLAGSGAQEHVDALKKHVQDLGIVEWVRWIDPLEPSRRHLAHAAADIFVSVADNVQEACGITPMEALASGVPQVVSDWDGYGETVQHGQTGFVIPTFWIKDDQDLCLSAGLYDNYERLDHFALAQSVAVDLETLQKSLQTLIENEDLRQRMAEKSRKRALAEYEPSRVISIHEQLWRELVEIARQLPFQPGADRCYDTPAFVEWFGHYGTRVLDDTARIVITDIGRRVATGEDRLPLVASFGVLSEALLTEILVALAAGGSHDIRGLLGHLARVHSPLPAGAGRHVMWLVKYGLAAVRA
jgi:D-inositol-3-phosphate glycosyltransferase